MNMMNPGMQSGQGGYNDGVYHDAPPNRYDRIYTFSLNSNCQPFESNSFDKSIEFMIIFWVIFKTLVYYRPKSNEPYKYAKYVLKCTCWSSVTFSMLEFSVVGRNRICKMNHVEQSDVHMNDMSLIRRSWVKKNDICYERDFIYFIECS